MDDINDNNQSPQSDPSIVSPDQMALFEEQTPEVTRMDIPHQTLAAIDETQAEQSEEANEEVSGAKKIKILAALAIVAAAGYIAYWVQEPVQIKAEVTGSDVIAENTPIDTATASDVATDTAMGTASSPSVNVDVSLFGFEPATLKIDKGTTVIWTNTSTEDQTIVGSSEEGQSFVSPVLASGESFSYDFDQDSSFQYYSTYNPALKASILVGLGSQPFDAALPATDDQLSPAATESSPVIPPVTTAPPSAAPGASLEDGIAQTHALSTTTENDNLATSDMSADDDMKPSAPETPTKLAKTGPEDLLYLLAIFVIGWLNRKSLWKALKKY